MVADERIDLRPKARKSTSGLVLTNASTMPLLSPAGDIAGAKAMNRLTFSLRPGCIESVAKACAVPWLKPIYESDGCDVVSRI